MKKYTYGITLSGGGARGLAHIGVLAALESNGIVPEIISGSSMGAIIGVFYAAGFKPAEILEIAKKNEKFYKIFNWSIPKRGMLNLDYIRTMLEENIPTDNFESLKKEFYVCVSNITKGEEEIISSGPLFQAVIASASIPIIFTPQVINGNTYVDGGLLNDLPVEPLMGHCEHLIASHVNYTGTEMELNNIKDIAERVYRLAVFQKVKINFKKCDYIIDPPELKTHGIFEFKHIDTLFDIGYKAAQNMINLNPEVLLGNKIQQIENINIIKNEN